MAGKITIRHKGGCFPTLCLLLLLMVVAAVTWLSTAGLPESLLRCIERAAAQQGLYLRIGKARLYPSSGLAIKAEGLELRAQAGDVQPLATLGKAVVGMRIFGLFTGDYLPASLSLTQGKVLLPVDGRPGEYFDISLERLSAKSNGRHVLRLTEASLNLEGISLQARGSIDLSSPQEPQPVVESTADAPESDAQAPLVNVAGLLQTIQPQIREAYRVIHCQHWQESGAPALDITFRVAEQVQATLHLNIPRYDVELFHFRNGEALLDYRDNAVIIHELKLHTIEPDSEVRLQGGYDIVSRLLSFRLNSNAPLIRMAERLVEDAAVHGLLSKVRHPEEDTPDIKLSGHLKFTESYTPADIKLQGDIHQQRLSIGGSLIDNAVLSFHYDNGNFHIHQCTLSMPDGELKLEASLKNCDGKAEFKADIDAAKLLALVSEFTPDPIALPSELALQGHTRLALDIGLRTSPFTPGTSAWEDLVPRLETVSFAADVDEARYAGLVLKCPALAISTDQIVQGADMLPSRIQKIGLKIGAQAAQWSAETADTTVSLENFRLQLCCEGGILLRNLTGDAPDISVPHGTFSLGAQQLRHGSLAVDSISCSLLADKGFRLSGKVTEMLQNAQIELHALGMRDGDCALGQAVLRGKLDDTQPDTAQLVLNITSPEGRTLFLAAKPDWARPEHPALHSIEAELPLAAFAPVLEHFGLSTSAIEWPDNVSLRGYASFDTENKRLAEGQLHVSIPKLVRTPTQVKALAGHPVTLGIESDIHLATPPGGVLGFAADLDIAQQTGSFKGRLSGDARGHLNVTGHNTIRADVLDSLIDLSEAHNIIRDFRFYNSSRTIVSDINVDIDLSDANGGVRVDSFCKAELLNVAYMLGAIQDRPGGAERVRQDLGADPFTLCTRATCSVLVHVASGCTTPSGAKEPDACTITLGNAYLEYDNTPWLKRQGFENGTRTTSLTGDSIIIDVEHSFVEINNVIGTVYPAYSFGMFYPDLQDFMADVLIYSPAQVDTQQCVFPIYSDCERPMSGTIRIVCAAESGFRFIGTTIPLVGFSGFVYLTDDYVQLDRLNAVCWEGVLDAVVKIGFSGKHTTFDGYATAGAMNLKSIAAAYGSKQSDALCDASIRFRADSPELKDIQAYGYANIQDGDLLTLRIFRPVSDLISDIPGYFAKLETTATKAMGAEEGTKILSWVFESTGKAVSAVGSRLDSWTDNIPFANHVFAYNLKEAYMQFSIGNGHLETHGMNARGSNLKIFADLDLDLDSMKIRGNMWPQLTSLPTIILSPITFLSDYIIDIKINGPIDDLQWGVGLDARLQGTEASATAE